MASIYLIRHGQASFMEENYDQLSPLGIRQSMLLGDYFRQQELEISYHCSGTLERQQHTFQHFASKEDTKQDILSTLDEHQGPSVFKKQIPNYFSQNSDVAVRFQKNGRHDPLVRKALVKAFFQWHLQWAAGDLDSGQYESWHDFKKRGDIAFEQIKQLATAHETIGVFTSGGVIAHILGRVLGISDEKVVELNWQVKNTSFSELQVTPNRIILKSFNNTPHLSQNEITFV